jgi:hypothetical protein
VTGPTSVNADWSLTRYIILNIDFGTDCCTVTNMTRIFKNITSKCISMNKMTLMKIALVIVGSNGNKNLKI